MEHRPDTVDPASLAPPYRAVIEGLRAQVAALAERNRELERREPEAVVEGLRSRVASLAEHNRRLEHLLRELRRAMFGKKSEKLHPDQLQLAFEALEGALAEAEEAACVFQSKSITHSIPFRSLIPFQTDHLFQSQPITDSSAEPIIFAVGTGTVGGV